VKLLLDTHAFLYWTEDNPRLPRRARAAIARPRSIACISVATIWEIRIKVAKGRLRTDFTNVAEEAQKHRFDVLPIMADHAQAAGDLPPHHEDPFDRMLIAQARAEAMTLVTGDAAFGEYGVPLLWE
jgi:PIN domain nuclease of toxin-antitoxin system